MKLLLIATLFTGLFLNPLPQCRVDLSSFELESTAQGNVDVNWVTSSEVNNLSFTLEQGIDGTSWKTIATIPGAGNSQHDNFYYYEDEDPFQGANHYRLSDHCGNIIIIDEVEL